MDRSIESQRSEKRREVYCTKIFLSETTRAHLVKSHPELITLHEVVTRKRSFYSDSATLKRKRVALKPWTPTRPDLAVLVATALESNECVTTVPEDKRSESRLP